MGIIQARTYTNAYDVCNHYMVRYTGTLLQRENKNGWSLPGTGAGAIIEKIIKCKLNVTPVLNSIRYKLHMIMINGTYIDEQKKLLIIIFMYICVLILEG